jgi:hypothetical protein
MAVHRIHVPIGGAKGNLFTAASDWNRVGSKMIPPAGRVWAKACPLSRESDMPSAPFSITTTHHDGSLNLPLPSRPNNKQSRRPDIEPSPATSRERLIPPDSR